MDHGRHVELGQLLVQREPVLVGHGGEVQYPPDGSGSGCSRRTRARYAPAQLGHRSSSGAARACGSWQPPAKWSREQLVTRRMRSLQARAQRWRWPGRSRGAPSRCLGEKISRRAALAPLPQLVALDALPDLVVADRARGRPGPGRAGELGELAYPELAVPGRDGGEVAVASMIILALLGPDGAVRLGRQLSRMAETSRLTRRPRTARGTAPPSPPAAWTRSARRPRSRRHHDHAVVVGHHTSPAG